MTTKHQGITQGFRGARLLAAAISLLLVASAHAAGAYGMLTVADVGDAFVAPSSMDQISFSAELANFDDEPARPEGPTGAVSEATTDPILADMAWIAATDPELATALGYEEITADWPEAAATLDPLATPPVDAAPIATDTASAAEVATVQVDVVDGSVRSLPHATADGFELAPEALTAAPIEPDAHSPSTAPSEPSPHWLARRSALGIGSIVIARSSGIAAPAAASVAIEETPDADAWDPRALLVAPTPIRIAAEPADWTPPAVSSRGSGSERPADAIEIASNEPSGRPAPAPRASRSGGLPELDGVIEPGEIVDVGAAVSGILETIDVERSDFVEAGQMLASLESGYEIASVDLARARAALKSEIASGKANLALGKRRVERTDRLYEKRAVSIESKDEAETEAQLAKVELDRAQENKRLAELELERAVQALNRRQIASPISGVVVERFLSPGELVAEDPIVRIARLDPLRIEVIAPADLFGQIAPGMRAEIVPEGTGRDVLSATVSLVDRTIDAASGTFGLRLSLPNPDLNVPGGLRCKVRILPD